MSCAVVPQKFFTNYIIQKKNRLRCLSYFNNYFRNRNRFRIVHEILFYQTFCFQVWKLYVSLNCKYNRYVSEIFLIRKLIDIFIVQNLEHIKKKNWFSPLIIISCTKEYQYLWNISMKQVHTFFFINCILLIV